MKRLVIGFGIGLIILAGRDAAAQGRGWIAPQCDLSTGHYLVNSAVLYLRNAGTTRFADQRERDMRDARRVLMQALDQGRDDDPAVWYFLGRYYASHRDLAGADSAFDRAERLAPQCAEDIGGHRRILWVPVLNRGVDALRAGDTDQALSEFRLANTILGAEPTGFYYMGQIFATRQAIDSALSYFTNAIAIATDEDNRENEQYTDIRKNAAFNVARLYHRMQNHDSAIVWYQRYRDAHPGDPEAITGHASALSESGRAEEAVVLYDSVLALANDISPLDLFSTGVALFRADQLEKAATAFELGLERNPHFRDALFNLANTYLSLSDADSGLSEAARDSLHMTYGERMAPVTARLVAVDPASAASLRLRAAAFQLLGMQDSTLAILEQIEAMPFDVTVSVFQPVSADAWEMRGIISNQKDDPVVVPAITVEFIDASGEIVDSVRLESQELDGGGGLAPFVAQPQGEEIAAWRYRLES